METWRSGLTLEMSGTSLQCEHAGRCGTELILDTVHGSGGFVYPFLGVDPTIFLGDCVQA
jgi:hypothetical protein